MQTTGASGPIPSNNLRSEIVNDFLKCQICLACFQHPKALPCLHSFCENCLRDYVNSRQKDTDEHFPCPLCRRDIPLPPGGVAEFPDNHLLNSLCSTIINDQKNSSSAAPLVDLQLPRSPRSANHKSRDQSTLCFGQYGLNVQEFTAPVGVTVSQDGYIIISDKRDDRIMIYDQRGNLKAFFYCRNSDIYNIVMTKFDQLLVANAKAGPSLVSSYNLNGRFTAKLGSQFTHDKPSGVAVTSSGNVVVTTTEPAVVYILNENGKLICQFGGSAVNGGLLKKPCNVAVNGKDEIIISDCRSNCLKAYTPKGQFLYDVGRAPALLNAPQGLCIDAEDNIIVADAGNHRVVKFDSNGKLVNILVKETNRIDTRMKERDVKPQNVVVTNDTLIVVLRGKEFAEVRLYPYTARVRHSTVCTCM